MHRLGLTIAAIAVAIGTLGSADSAVAAAPAWWSYNRPADYTTVKSDIVVPVRDGTLIHCVLALPAKSGQAAAGKFPGLIEEYDPYGALSLESSHASGDDYWADHGYAAMVCDVRGTGLSGGVWLGILSVQENQDDYDLLQWMRTQPWSDGRLGQLGGSYGGMTTMRVASLHPPGLLAISPLSSEYNLYQEDVYPGGIKSTPGTGDTWPLAVTGLSGGREIAAETEGQYLQHPLWDDFWKQIAVSTKWTQITVPVLGIGGFQDMIVSGGAPANWIGLHDAGNPQNYLIVGPWGHASTGPPFTLPAGAQLAWFDHWLKQLPDAPLPTSPVTSFEQPAGVTSAGVSFAQSPTQLPPGQDTGRGWQNETTWPPPGTHQVSWALTRDNQIAPTPGATGSESYTTLPTDSGYTGEVDDGVVSPNAQKAVFTTGPLTQDIVIAGRIVVNLRATLSNTDGNLKALLYDVAHDGSATYIQEGYLKASHRLSDEQETAVTPGVVTDLPVQIWPTDWRFAKGDQLRLVIYGGESTELEPEPVPVTTTLSLGAGGSTVSLPILGSTAPTNTNAPPAFSCAEPSGRLAGVTLGPVRLGMTRARVRSRFSRVSLRGRRYMDFFCPPRGGIRVGYASPVLLHTLSHSQQRRARGRDVLVLTANHHYALRGVRPGTRLATVARRLRAGQGFHVGLNWWYLTPNGQSRGVLKVRRGVIEEIGIANSRLTNTRQAARRFFRTFY